MIERKLYDPIGDHDEGISRRNYFTNAESDIYADAEDIEKEYSENRGRILHDSPHRSSYQQYSNLDLTLENVPLTYNPIDVNRQHGTSTAMTYSSPLTPRVDNSTSAVSKKRIVSDSESPEKERAPTPRRESERKVSNRGKDRQRSPRSSSPMKNSKSIMKHLSFITSNEEEDDSIIDDTDHGKRRLMKVSLVFITMIFILGTIVHRNLDLGGIDESGTEQTTSIIVDSLSNQEALASLESESSVSDMPHGAVASDNEICSDMGLAIMKDYGGNAVDAAVTTTLCLGLVNPASSGIGGGAFILIHAVPRSGSSKSTQRSTPFLDRRKQNATNHSTKGRKMGKITEVIDCRETAPGDATYDMFEKLDPSASTEGALSIGIPGELRGVELAHQRFGQLDWEEVLQPVVDLAERGVTISSYLAKDIYNNRQRIDQFAPTKEMLTKNNDGETYLKAGQKMKRSSYANTLRNIAMHGADYIYTGDVAAQMAEEIQAAGGIVSAEDLENYRPVLRDPVVAQVDGFNVVSVPPPSSGGATIIGVLRFLSGYMQPFATFSDSLSIHRLVEAFKHAFAVRMSLSDPDFFTNVTEAAVKDLVSGPFMEELRLKTPDNDVLPLSKYGGTWAQLLDDDDQGHPKDAHEGDRKLKMPRRQNHRQTRLFNYLEDHGTTSLSIVDEHRNSVSITSSVNYYFGSCFSSVSTGILFNDQMDDFATPGRPNLYGMSPAKSNYIAPNKRPISSMSPTMVFNTRKKPGVNSTESTFGRLLLVLGASGGPKIITTVLQVILNHLYLAMPLYDSVIHPRVHNQLLYHGSATTGFDRSVLPAGPLVETSKRTRRALEKRNHTLIAMDYLGTCQAISMDLETNTMQAVSDPRKYGKSAGY